MLEAEVDLLAACPALEVGSSPLQCSPVGMCPVQAVAMALQKDPVQAVAMALQMDLVKAVAVAL